MNSIMKKESGYQPTFGSVVDQIFQNNLHEFFGGAFGNPGRGGNIVPVNILETGKDYELQLIAPGFRKEDFKLTLDKEQLTVSFAQTTPSGEQQKGRWVRREYCRQDFTRTFHLDETVDVSGIGARYEQGVLHVNLPKKEGGASPVRDIQVQ